MGSSGGKKALCESPKRLVRKRPPALLPCLKEHAAHTHTHSTVGIRRLVPLRPFFPHTLPSCRFLEKVTKLSRGLSFFRHPLSPILCGFPTCPLWVALAPGALFPIGAGCLTVSWRDDPFPFSPFDGSLTPPTGFSPPPLLLFFVIGQIFLLPHQPPRRSGSGGTTR